MMPSMAVWAAGLSAKQTYLMGTDCTIMFEGLLFMEFKHAQLTQEIAFNRWSLDACRFAVEHSGQWELMLT